MSKAILLSVGIEKAVDGYTVSGTMIANTFDPNGVAETKVVSADGTTVTLALDKLAADQGRKISLAHCNLIVIGASLSTENVAIIFEYFLKKFEISNNALLVWASSDVAKTLEAGSKNKTDSAGGLLETIANYNGKRFTLDRFYKDYLKGQLGFMSAVSLEDGEISNTRKMAVFKNGIYIGLKDNDVSGTSTVQVP